MIMFNYIFPIFAFGLIMTGIVFLGLQQASDLAKNLAAEKREAENNFKSHAAISPEDNSATVQAPTIKSRQ
jgi:hypothetical protein